MSPQHSPRRRGLWATGLLCAGNAIAHEGVAAPSLWTYAACLAMAIVAAMLRGAPQKLALAAAVLALGHATYTSRVLERSPGNVEWMLSESPALLEIEGTIATAPRIERPQRGRFAPFAWYEKPVTRFEFRTSRVIIEDGASRRVTGRLWIRIGEAAPQLRAGDRVRIVGMASRLERPTNPGERDARLSAAQRGIVGRLSADSMGTVALLEHSSPVGRIEAAWLRGVAQVRARAREWIESGSADDPSRALLVGLLLGERSDAMRELTGAFSRVGLAHVLSVSGFHLVAFVMTLVLVIRLHGEHPRLEPILVGVCVLAYLVVMPSQAPIIRAGAMTLGLLAAESFGRRYDRLNTLALVLGGVVLWRPMELWDIGCQLSFLSVAALIAFAHPLRVRLFGERPNRDELAPVGLAVEWCKDAIAASIAAWALTAPLVAYHLGVVSPLAPLATLATLPLSVLVVGLGYAGVVMGLAVPWTSEPARWLIDTGAQCLASAVLWMDGLPGGVVYVRGHGVSVAWALGATVVVGWCMSRASWRRPGDVAATIVLVVWTIARLWSPVLGSNIPMRMDTLDVGDGSCHLLRSGDEALMYDCGSAWYAIGERVVPSATRALGVPRVGTIILSHPDIDHFAGVLDVIRPLGVRRVLIGEAFARQALESPDGPASYLLMQLRAAGVGVDTISAGESVRLGSLTLHVLAPETGFTSDRDNDASLVVRVEVPTHSGPRRLLLCGDIESAAIARVRPLIADTRIDVMEAPHHGSARPPAIAWVADVDPGVVVQSTGPSRAGDDRWRDVREGREWLCTAEGGAAWVEVRRDGSVSSGYHRAN